MTVKSRFPILRQFFKNNTHTHTQSNIKGNIYSPLFSVRGEVRPKQKQLIVNISHITSNRSTLFPRFSKPVYKI